MAKDREDHEERDESRGERNRQADPDDDRPRQHRARIGQNRAHADAHRGYEIHLAIDDEGRRGRGNRKDEERDDRAQRVADQQERQTVSGSEDIGEQLRERGNVGAIEREEDKDRDVEPDDQGEEADKREPPKLHPRSAPDRAENRRPGQGLAVFETARNLISPRRAKRREQRKTHDERIGEIGIIQRENRPDDHEAADCVERAEEHAVLRRASEVVHPLGDAVDDIRDFDMANIQSRRPAGVGGVLIGGARPRADHNGHRIAPLVAASLRAARDRTTFRAGDQQCRPRRFAAVEPAPRGRLVVGASPIRSESHCRSARAVS